MYCRVCRRLLPANATACPVCGEPVTIGPKGIVVEGSATLGAAQPAPPPVEEEPPLARRMGHTRLPQTPIGSLTQLAKEAWNEPVVRAAAGAALVSLGAKLAGRVMKGERARQRFTEFVAAMSQGYSEQTQTQSSPDAPPETRTSDFYEAVILLRRMLRGEELK